MYSDSEGLQYLINTGQARCRSHCPKCVSQNIKRRTRHLNYKCLRCGETFENPIKKLVAWKGGYNKR